VTNPYGVIAFAAVLAAFGYYFPQLLIALYVTGWIVPIITIVCMNLMAYWLLIPSFKYKKECPKCGGINRLSARACSECKQAFPPETSPYEVIAFALTLFAFGWSFPQLLAAIQLTALAVFGLSVPAILILGAWLLMPNFKQRRICDECGSINWRSAKKCYKCEAKFG